MTSLTGSKDRKLSFTLVELLLTLSIIGIILGLSVPLINKNVRKNQFRSLADKVYLFLDYAKAHSILKNEVLEFSFDEAQGILALRKSVEDREEVEDEEKALRILKVPARIELDLDAEKILFFPDGSLSEFRIDITDSQERRAEVSSRGFDGKISLKLEK